MKPQIMNNWDPPDTVHERVVADQFGGTYEILGKSDFKLDLTFLVLCILSIVGAILHSLFMWRLWRMKNTLTLRLLWLSSTFQVFYIFAIGIPGISHLIFREWIFGFTACKAFLSLKTISSGVCINVTGRFQRLKEFILNFSSCYNWRENVWNHDANQTLSVGLETLLSGLSKFARFEKLEK